MPSWTQRASLLLLFFLSFDTSALVFGALHQPSTRLGRQLKPLGAETNAKRFASGLPPLPPMKRGSATDTARRSSISDTLLVTRKIRVEGGLGYLQRTSDHSRYIIGPADSADLFQATLTTGGTFDANFYDLDAPGTPYLAVLTSPGIDLSGANPNVGILGGASLPTSQGSTPQSSGTISTVGYEYETAIWYYNQYGYITPFWYDHNGDRNVLIGLHWDPVAQTIYVSAYLNYKAFPGTQPVTLRLDPE